ncbi:MAG: hypothetical protein EZS28_047329, partial [Streblomastix strix]
ADSSVVFQADKDPRNQGFYDQTVYYNKNGGIQHRDGCIYGNCRPEDRQRVAFEVNMTTYPRTLDFFFYDQIQRNFVSFLPPEIRFWVCIHQKDSQQDMEHIRPRYLQTVINQRSDIK